MIREATIREGIADCDTCGEPRFVEYESRDHDYNEEYGPSCDMCRSCEMAQPGSGYTATEIADAVRLDRAAFDAAWKAGVR